MMRLPMLSMLAASLWLALPAQAQQRVQVYGLMDVSAGRFEAAGSPRVWRTDNGAMTTSFLGIKGSDDLGGGLQAKFKIEHFLRADTGQAGRFDGDAFWARDAYVGLSGAFGTTVLGRNTTPLFVSTVLFNAFGDSYGFSPSVRHLFTPALLPFFGDSGWNNSIAYASVDHDGLTWNLEANLGEAASGATGRNFGANLLYFTGPLGATAAWQRVQNGAGISPAAGAATPPGFARQDTWQLGLSYEIGGAKLFGQYGHIYTKALAGTSTTMWSMGAAVPLGPGRVLAQYGQARARANASEPTNKTLSIGYDVALSRSTDVYAAFMNDKVTGLSNGNSLAAGARLRF
ncbi:MAG TPA: porin [Albitalea sp.]|uniref:porin n=1 Tax=Piscinibacter sp. TaxID=1903157 RepID=UPI002ED60F4D